MNSKVLNFELESHFIKYCLETIFEEKNINTLILLEKSTDVWLHNNPEPNLEKFATQNEELEKGRMKIKEEPTLICQRKIGCPCAKCKEMLKEFSIKTSQNLKNNLTYSSDLISFADSDKSTQILFLYQENGMKFKSLFAQLGNAYSISKEETVAQERFLQAINELSFCELGHYPLLYSILKNNVLINIISLCFGHSDNMRWRSVQILLHLALGHGYQRNEYHFKFPINNIDSQLLSDKVYTELYDMERWIEPFQQANLTAKSRILYLNKNELTVLRKFIHFSNEQFFQWEKNTVKTSGGIELPKSWFLYMKEIWKEKGLATEGEFLTIEKLQLRLEEQFEKLMIKINENSIAKGTFIKLSTRSPKDSKILTIRYEKTLIRLKNEFKDIKPYLECLSSEDLNDFMISEARRASMRNMTAFEALDILCTSQRVEDDLDVYEMFEFLNDGEKLISIILREFVENIPQFCEFRGFVVDFRLNALTQYQEDKCYSWVIRNRDIIQEKIKYFFNNEANVKIREVGISHAVIDFGLIIVDNEIKAVQIIELNSFGFRSGSCFFSWDNEEDYRVMVKGPFQFRIKVNSS